MPQELVVCASLAFSRVVHRDNVTVKRATPLPSDYAAAGIFQADFSFFFNSSPRSA